MSSSSQTADVSQLLMCFCLSLFFFLFIMFLFPSVLLIFIVVDYKIIGKSEWWVYQYLFIYMNI